MINREKLHDTNNIDNIINTKLQEVFGDSSLTFDRSSFAGGLTNYNYLMKIQGKDYIVREPGILTERMIDRQAEKRNTEVVSNLGINSECLYLDPETGVKISVFVANSHNLAQDNPFSKKNIRAVTDLLKQVHQSEETFKNTFDWQAELTKYEEVIDSINGNLFFDYYQLKEKLTSFFAEYVKESQFVPCHNDTVPENFLLDDAGNYYLIDWEYAGLNDVNFDLAAFMVETRLPKEAIDTLLFEYYGQQIPADAIQKIKGYILAQDLLWTVWALIRHYSGDNFLDYCQMRYERFRKNILALEKDPTYSLEQMVTN